jgi:hypothetical protein
MKSFKQYAKLNEAESLHWDELSIPERKDYLKHAGIKGLSMSGKKWNQLDRQVQKKLVQMIRKTTHGEYALVESKMSELHMLIKQGKSAEQIAKIMKVDVKTIKELMKESIDELDEFGGAGTSKDYSSKSYPSSYRKNKKLLALIDKYDDPFKFILAVVTAMSAGKLKLRRIGVANTREIAALWNDMKNKKISPSLIEYVMSLSTEQLLDEGVLDKVKDFFKDTRRKVDVKGWKVKLLKGPHKDYPEIRKGGDILVAVDPKSGEEHHMASGKLDKKQIRKIVNTYGLVLA